MRVLAGADLHGDPEVLDWLVATASGGGAPAMILAGDLLLDPREGHDEEAVRAGAEAFAGRLAQAGCPVYYVLGNHDRIDPEWDAVAVNLHGRRVALGEWSLVGYRHCLGEDPGPPADRSEKQIADDLAALAARVDASTVLVTHYPARDVLDRGRSGRSSGSRAIRRFVETTRPRFHVHGHKHWSFGVEPPHVNAASGGVARGVWLDVESGRAEPVGDIGGIPRR